MIEVWKLDVRLGTDFYPRNAHSAVTVARGGDARKGKQSRKADKDRKFVIEAHFAGRKSLM